MSACAPQLAEAMAVPEGARRRVCYAQMTNERWEAEYRELEIGLLHVEPRRRNAPRFTMGRSESFRSICGRALVSACTIARAGE